MSPADLTNPFGPSCCDGGGCSDEPLSAQPCGCDPGLRRDGKVIGHLCAMHREAAESQRATQAQAEAVAGHICHEAESLQRLVQCPACEAERKQLKPSPLISDHLSANPMKWHINHVTLVGHYGSDWTHAQSAWTSTSRDLDEDKRRRMPALLKMLAKEGHHTPFEKSMLHFLVLADTASHIHQIKHRIGVSVNGESARYKELKEDQYLIPRDWPQSEQDRLHEFCLIAFGRYHSAVERLTPLLGKKRAKESARFYLPYANQLVLDVSFNWRSFMHFQELRNDDHAQLEIHTIAQHMLKRVQELGDFKYSLEAFGYEG